MSAERKLLPCVELGQKDRETLIFLSGFPDNQLSACAPLVEQLKGDYHILAMCFPDFDLKGDEVNNARAWGYNFSEVDQMLEATIREKLGHSSRFTLVVHDWGCVLGGLYENKRPDRVKRMVMMDVGIKKKLSPYEAVVILIYQWWFAVAYVISQTLGSTVGNVIFYGFFIFSMCFPFLSVQSGKSTPRPSEDLKVHMCYPYYHFWKALILLDTSIKMKFPTCPLLYLVCENC